MNLKVGQVEAAARRGVTREAPIDRRQPERAREAPIDRRQPERAGVVAERVGITETETEAAEAVVRREPEVEVERPAASRPRGLDGSGVFDPGDERRA